MSPFQHGEVFVTDDGAETDLDLGHYERFIDECVERDPTSPPAALQRRDPEGAARRLSRRHGPGHSPYHQRDQAPHARLAKKLDADVVITEIGGTVGDIESLPFLEAIRQMRKDIGRENMLYIHVTLVPFIGVAARSRPSRPSTA